jgi:hypothetical protein
MSSRLLRECCDKCRERDGQKQVCEQLDDLASLAGVWRGTLTGRRNRPAALHAGEFDAGFDAAMAVCIKQLDQAIARLRQDATL